MPSVADMTTVDASVFEKSASCEPSALADLSANNRIQDDGSINLADDELMCMIDSIGKNYYDYLFYMFCV